jgi:hypothetical protein
VSLPSVPVTRRSRSIDTQPFSGVMAEALTAYAQDPAYAVAMTKQASTIQNKRDVWAIRTELRRAEETARTACAASSESFTCKVTSPCGTGNCRFATGDLRRLDIPATPGRTERPDGRHASPYSIEAAVQPLRMLRGTSA